MRNLLLILLLACGLHAADITAVLSAPVVSGKTATLIVNFTSAIVDLQSVSWSMDVATGASVSVSIVGGTQSTVRITKAYKGRKYVTFSLPAITAVDQGGRALTVAGAGQERTFRL